MVNKKKSLGQYYTSPAVADFMVSMSDSSKRAKVIEAGFGKGVFLDALQKSGYKKVTGYEVDKRSFNSSIRKSPFELFNKSFFEASNAKSKQVKLIVGNPPYVQWNNIDSKAREFLKTDPFWKNYSNGEWDLLYAFIIWGVEVLKEGGELIFIVPYNWFSSTYAASLRNYLIDNGHFTDIVHFNEYKIFEDAAPNAIIFRYKKEKLKKPPKIKVVEFKAKQGTPEEIIEKIRQQQEMLESKNEIETEEWRAFHCPPFKRDSFWHLASQKQARLIRLIEKAAPDSLADVADIAVGVVSGYDAAYLVSDNEYRSFSLEEKKLVKEFVKAKHCQRFFLDKPSKFIFADHIETESALKKYPNIYKHLLAHKKELVSRYSSKQKWWHWATIRNKKLFDDYKGKRIFVPGIDRSRVARYSATKKRVYGAGDVVAILAKEVDPDYLLAWLNSEVSNSWYRIKGSRTGHRTRYTHSHLRNVPFLKSNSLTKKQLKTVVNNSRLLQGKINNEKRAILLAENDAIFEKVVLQK